MPSRIPRKPVFTRLSLAESRVVLDQNHVGHLAFLNERQLDIEPVHYVMDGDWVFIRSAAGAKLEAFAHNPYVAFEVDEIHGTFDWRSVVAHGTVYVLSAEGSRADAAQFERALDALRSFVPEAFTADDPTPFRQTVYGIHLDRITGRMAEQNRRQSPRARVGTHEPPASRPRTPDDL